MGDHVVDGGPTTWYNSDHECSDWEYSDSGWNLEQLYTGYDTGNGTGGKLTIYSIPSNSFRHGYNPNSSFARCYDYIWSSLKNSSRLFLLSKLRPDSPILLKYTSLIPAGIGT